MRAYLNGVQNESCFVVNGAPEANCISYTRAASNRESVKVSVDNKDYYKETARAEGSLVQCCKPCLNARRQLCISG